MKETDLSPKSVDSLPIRTWKPSIEILDYRVGHIFDPHGYLTNPGIMAKDSQGIEWEIMESRIMGVFKRRKREGAMQKLEGSFPGAGVSCQCDGNTQQGEVIDAVDMPEIIDKSMS